MNVKITILLRINVKKNQRTKLFVYLKPLVYICINKLKQYIQMKINEVINNEVNAFVSYANTFKPLSYKEVMVELNKDYPTQKELKQGIIQELNKIKYFPNGTETKKE